MTKKNNGGCLAGILTFGISFIIGFLRRMWKGIR